MGPSGEGTRGVRSWPLGTTFCEPKRVFMPKIIPKVEVLKCIHVGQAPPLMHTEGRPKMALTWSGDGARPR